MTGSQTSLTPSTRARVAVTLVTWNAVHDVGPCLESVRAQTHPPVQVRVFDNASTDGTADRVAADYPDIELHRNERNAGYAAAQNQGLALAMEDGVPYVLFLTPDVVLAPDHLARLIATLEANPELASAGGKLLRPDGRTLDSTGIVATPDRLFRDRGQGEPDCGQYDDPTRPPPFAPCGAAVLHRAAALQDAAVRGEVLDASFVAYKEDIDLAWRLRLRGWRVAYVPGATARHGRAAPYSGPGPGDARSPGAVRRNRRRLSPRVRRLSARNQLLLLVKNEHPRVLVSQDALRIIARQLALLAYTLVLEPTTLPAYASFLTHLPGALIQRLRFHRRVDHRSCRAWFHPTVPPPETHFPPATE